MTHKTKHTIPKIRELSLFTVNLDHHANAANFSDESLKYTLGLQLNLNKTDQVSFLLKIRMEFAEEGQENPELLFVAVYQSTVNLERVERSKSSVVKIEKKQLAHLLGMSILMIRGALTSRLQSEIYRNHPMPLLNPTKILENQLQVEDDYFLDSLNTDNQKSRG